MPNTPNYGWNMPTVGSDFETWADELNALFVLQDAEIFLKANKANPVFTGTVTVTGGVTVSGQVSANSATITGNVNAGSISTPGNLTVGGSATITGTLGVTGTLSFGAAAASASVTSPVFIGTPSAILRPTVDSATAIQFQNGAGTIAAFIDTQTTGRFSSVAGFVGPLLLGTPSVVVRPTADSANSIQFQNAAGTPILTVDTLNPSAIANTFKANGFLGVAKVTIRPTVDSADGIRFETASLTLAASIDTTLSQFVAGTGGVRSVTYWGNSAVVLRPMGTDGVNAIQFQTTAGGVAAQLDTATSTFQTQTFKGLIFRGDPTVNIRPSTDGAGAVVIQNVAGAQLVQINTSSGGMALGSTAPTTGASIDLQRTDRALTLNRMTSAQRLAISAGDQGMVVFDRDLQKIFVTTNTGWVQVG
jgi:hypothetical protein